MSSFIPFDRSQLETRKNRVISGEAGWLDDVEVLRGAPRVSFGPISTMPGVDSAGFADLQTALYQPLIAITHAPNCAVRLT
jgi:hypothetical protein